MTESHFEDPDPKNSMLEIGLPSGAVAKDNFTDYQGKQIRMENQTEAWKQKELLHCCCSHGPGCLRSLFTREQKKIME